MPEEYRSMCLRHLKPIDLSKHRIDLLDHDLKPVDSAAYRTELTARKLAAAEIGRTITEKVVELANI